MRGERLAIVDLWYPRCEGPRVAEVEVGLMDVRAADSIRITYDFERDGYSIKQAANFSWEADDEAHDEDWQEVAFVKAWAREKPGPLERYEAERGAGDRGSRP